MNKYAKLEVSIADYESLKNIQILNNAKIVKEQHIGSRKSLYVQDTLIATSAITNSLYIGDISKHQFNAFLGMFSKQLYKQFQLNDNLYDLQITFTEASRGKNYAIFEELCVGDYFYNIDLSSAYWQIAHKLGYLSTKVFEKYMNSDEYKQAKRLCISFLARPNKMIYTTEDDSYEIICDTSVLKRVYDNIRAMLYIVINEARKIAPNHVEYNIDGISVLSSEIGNVKQYFRDNDLIYKINECRKVSETQYLYAGEVRKFKNL